MNTPQERREAFKQDFKDLINKYNAKIYVEGPENADGIYLEIYLPEVCNDNKNVTEPFTCFNFRIDSTITLEEIIKSYKT